MTPPTPEKPHNSDLYWFVRFILGIVAVLAILKITGV